MIFRGSGQDRIALTAKRAVTLCLRKQCTNFWLAASGQQSQPIERTGQGALLDEFASTLAEPAGQLQARVTECAYIGQALTRCAFRSGKEKDRQRAKLAGQLLIRASEIVWSKLRCPIGDHGLRIGEAADFRARSINLDVQIGCTVVGIAQLENVHASTAVGMSVDGVG